MHFDKRLQPEDARIKLMSYKAPRNSDLAKVEAAIQSLASRAASNIPAGPSRTANYNMECSFGNTNQGQIISQVFPRLTSVFVCLLLFDLSPLFSQ